MLLRRAFQGSATPTPKYVLWFFSPQEIVEPMNFFTGPKAIKGDFKILTHREKKFKKEIKIIFTWAEYNKLYYCLGQPPCYSCWHTLVIKIWWSSCINLRESSSVGVFILALSCTLTLYLGGLGTVFEQKQIKSHPVAYIIMLADPSEKKYGITELETLCVSVGS